MEATKVGIREFRDKLATFVTESDTPLAITRHGDTVGYYLPVRRKRTDADQAALQEATAKFQEILDKHGISEDEYVEGFKKWRAEQHR